MISRKTILTMAMLMPTMAWAEPTLYPTDARILSSVTNQTDSNILADEKHEKTVWVLPPNTASAKVRGLHTPNANLGFCKDLVQSRAHLSTIHGKIFEVGMKEADALDSLLKLQEKASEKKVAAESHASLNGLADLLLIDGRIRDLAARNQEITESLNECGENCAALVSEMRVNNDELRGLYSDRREVFKRNRLAAEKYEGLKREAAAAEAAVDDQQKIYSRVQGNLQKLQEQFKGILTYYGGLEGAFASFSYKSHWDDNVQKLRDANPGINFAKVSTNEATVYTEINANGFIDGMSSIMGMSVAGQRQADGTILYPSYPESIDSNVRLSLMGACPQVFPDVFNLPASANTEMNYGITISYSYDSIYVRKLDVSYNMYKMYQKIIQSGKRGGFFRRRSFTSVEERNYFRDSFVVNWTDAENSWSDEEKADLEREIRDSIFTRLATLMLPQTINRAEILQATEPGKSGMAIVGEALGKYCGANVKCQAVGVVANFLDAVFGSTKVTSSYTNIQDAMITDSRLQVGKITKPWITTYVRE